MLLPPADPSGHRLHTRGSDQHKRWIFAQKIRGVPPNRVGDCAQSTGRDTFEKNCHSGRLISSFCFCPSTHPPAELSQDLRMQQTVQMLCPDVHQPFGATWPPGAPPALQDPEQRLGYPLSGRRGQGLFCLHLRW